MLDKIDLRDERRLERIIRIQRELQSALLDWQSKKHRFLSEPIGGSLAAFHPPQPSKKSGGKKIKPFVTGTVFKPLEPIKLHGAKLILEDKPSFKEPIVSPKMQANFRILDFKLDSKGCLFSSKPFDPDWNWKIQALWLRSIGIGFLQISKRLKLSLNTVKSMFSKKRLGISMSFFTSCKSKLDWATIGYKDLDTPSGWRAVLHGGCSSITGKGVLYPRDNVILDERSGTYTLPYKAHFSIGEKINKEYVLQTKEFNLEKHKKKIAKRLKEDIKHKMEIKLEQISVEVDNLQRNLLKGFNPETGKYEVDD